MLTFGTIGAFGFDDFDPPEVIGLYAGAGCRVVQAYRNFARNITPPDIVAVCEGLGLEIESLHAHFADDLDPSSEDESIRAKTLAFYQREAEYCIALGGSMLVVHPSPAHAPEGRGSTRYAQLEKSLDEFARMGEEMGVRFAFENMPPYHPVGADVAKLVDSVARTASPNVIFLLDIGHAHMTCGVGKAIRIAGPHLKATHVHDNDGVNDTHRLPYAGTIPWDEVRGALREIGYDGVFMLEAFEKANDLRCMLNADWKMKVGAILNGQ